MIKKILENLENKLFEESIDIPLTIKIEIGDQAPCEGPGIIDQPVEVVDIIDIPSEQPCADVESDEDAKVLAAIDDYFKTLNDGQYSPLSGEHNNASNNTEVYHIARKHNVDPAKLMSFLSDTSIFDKFQEISAKKDNLQEYNNPSLKMQVAKKIFPEKYREHIQKAVKAYFKSLSDRAGSTLTGIASAYQIPYDDLLAAVEIAKAKKKIMPESITEKKGRSKKSIKKGKEKALNDKTKAIGGNPVAKHDKNKAKVIPNAKPYDRSENKKIMMDDIFGKTTPDISTVAKKHGVSESEILRQLKMGIKIESEHTTDKSVAREIALDHLSEMPDYYSRLKKMEKVGESVKGMVGPYRDKLSMEFYWVPSKAAYYYPHDKSYVTGADQMRSLQKHTLPPIDTEKFPDRQHEGLEGPYCNSNGYVYYFCIKSGKYYDPLKGEYIESSSIRESKNSILESAMDKFVTLTEGKELSQYEAELLKILDSVGIDYTVGANGEIIVEDPWYTQLKKVYPKYAGILQRKEYCYEDASGGASCAGAVATVAVPLGKTIKRTNEAEICEICHKDVCECDEK